MNARAPHSRGFTLVEVMVALLIFGLLAAAGVALISFAVRAQGVVTGRLDDIGALNRLNAALVADLAQARNRPTRDRDGNAAPAFESGVGGALLVFVRGGWSNLDDAPRAEEQKVAYAVRNGTIVRIAWPALDGADPLPAAVMLAGVTDARLRFRVGGAWSDTWRGTPEAPLPDAVEWGIARADGRHYRAVFLVGTGYAPPPQPLGAPLG